MLTPGLIVLLLGGPAAADEAALWQDTRWVLEAESIVPVPIRLAAVTNTELLTKATQLRAVVHCDEAEAHGKKSTVVRCKFESVALKAVPHSDKPSQRELTNSQATVDDVVGRLKSGRLEFVRNHKGKITRVDVLDLSNGNSRERDSVEVLRLLATDLVMGFTMAAPPSGWESTWGERNGPLFRVPAARQANTANNQVHVGAKVDGRLVVQTITQGTATMAIPYDAWELASGDKVTMGLSEDEQLEGAGGIATPDGAGGGLGAASSGTTSVAGGTLKNGGATASAATPELRTYSGNLQSITVIDEDDSSMAERLWTVMGSSTGSVGASQGVNVWYNGHLRRLGQDEHVDVGTSTLVHQPETPIEGLQPWSPLNG
jgi:hypothetical protein